MINKDNTTLVNKCYDVSILIIKRELKNEEETKIYIRDNFSYEELLQISERFINTLTEDFIKKDPIETIKIILSEIKKDTN